MRVVSLVPSLTETVAVTVPRLLVGATDWCTHPAGLDVPRVGGSKYPDLARVLALRPDLVLVNVEENRRADADALRAAGIALHVTYPRTVDGALTELGTLLRRLGVPDEPGWLRAARAAWAGLPAAAPGSPGATHPPGSPGATRRAVVPVWRRPWVVLGADTFAGDVLRRLGVSNVYGSPAAGSPVEDTAAAKSSVENGGPAGGQGGDRGRYPRPTLAAILARRPELVVLPDEPYRFTATDGPECFPQIPCALVSGRHLTWYGPSLAEAPAVLGEQLRSAVRHPGRTGTAG